MPKRRRTRYQDRARRIAAERAHNRRERLAEHAARAGPDDDEPPF
ncbi:MAG TPA: hypothetical protein VLZ05_26225 [Mycobacterium sp.]|nr:hypothetical protein [Mycobacterium sp.]HUH72050.1 hypothetical protein [Mycobacterium sp.]